jgi:adhesin/invasin
LSFSSRQGEAQAGSGIGSSTTLSVNPDGLAPGVYQASVSVSAPGAVNDPQFIAVSLQVAATGAASVGDLSPKGMVFVAMQGAPPPPAQTLTVSNLGDGQLPFQLLPIDDSGGIWLQVTPSSGDAAAGPVSTQVQVNAEGLQPGVYKNRVRALFPLGRQQETEVMLVVVPRGTSSLRTRTACTPHGMDLLAATVGEGTILPMSFSAPLQARVVNTCGGAVDDASVMVDVDGGTITLRPLGNGTYGGNWTPAAAGDFLGVKFTALHPSYGSVQRSFTVTVVDTPEDQRLPSIDAVVDGAGFSQHWPLAPGSIISIFGSNLGTEEASSTALPLERHLSGVSVQVDGEDAPLFYAGPSQINMQLPFTVTPGQSVSIVVNVNGRVSAQHNVLILRARPGIFQSAEGLAAALDGQSRPISAQNPAIIGDTLQIYATGLGPVDPVAIAGSAAPASSTVQSPATVTVGGVAVPVRYQGLAPGFSGLYQINVLLLPTVPSGDRVAVVIEQDGIQSNPGSRITIPIAAPAEE